LSSKSKSRRGATRRRVRPGIEGLEQRLALSVSSAIVNGQLQVTGDGAADTITLDHSGASTFVNGQAFADSAITAGIRVNAGAGNDTFNILATVKPVAIDGQGGADKANLGRSGNAQEIAANVSVADTGSFIAITIDDSKDLFRRDVTLASSGASTTIGGLARGTVSYTSSQAASLHLLGGSGGDTFTVDDTTALGNVIDA